MGSGALPAARRPARSLRAAGAALALLAGSARPAAPGADAYPSVVTLCVARGDARRLIGTGFFAAPGVIVTAYHVARAAAFAGPPEEASVRIVAVLADGTALVVRGLRGAAP